MAWHGASGLHGQCTQPTVLLPVAGVVWWFDDKDVLKGRVGRRLCGPKVALTLRTQR